MKRRTYLVTAVLRVSISEQSMREMGNRYIGEIIDETLVDTFHGDPEVSLKQVLTIQGPKDE